MGSPDDAERSLRRALASLRRTAAAIDHGPALGDPDALARRLGVDEDRIRVALAELMAHPSAAEPRTNLAELVDRCAAGNDGPRIELTDGAIPVPAEPAAGCIERVLALATREAGVDGAVRVEAEPRSGRLQLTVHVAPAAGRRDWLRLRPRLLALRHAVLGAGGTLRWNSAGAGAVLHLELPA